MSAVSQQINSSVQNVAQPVAAAAAVEPSLSAAQPSATQLDRIDAMLAAQRAQQEQLGLALRAAKTGATSTAQPDASPAWIAPALDAHQGWFIASGLAVALLCAGFVIVWRGRFASAAAPQLAAQDSMRDSLLMASQDSPLQSSGPTPTEAVISQPAPSGFAAPLLADSAQHVDIDFDISVLDAAQADAASPVFVAQDDFVSDEVRKVQQSLAHKRSVRKSQQRALQPEVLMEMTEPTPEQVLASAFAPLPDPPWDVAVPAALRAPIVYPAQLTDEDAQWTVQLQLAQEMADLGQTEDVQALCQEVFVKGSEAMQGVALQILTQLPNAKQP
jgi:hypothetical protein